MFSAALLLLTGLFVRFFINPPAQSFSSLDWSGYVVNSDSTNPQPLVTSVSGSWIVPTVTATIQDAYSAAWVGIGGQLDNTLIQTGTEHDSIGGATEYSAWYELLPNDSITITQFLVSPGDRITASIRLMDLATKRWLMELHDVTKGESFSKSVFYDSSRLSGEWIMERPTVDNSIGALSDFGSITFADMNVTINAAIGTGSSFPHSQIRMSDRRGNALVSVSSLNNNGTMFTVTYLSVSAVIQNRIDRLREMGVSVATLGEGQRRRLSKGFGFFVGIGHSFAGQHANDFCGCLAVNNWHKIYLLSRHDLVSFQNGFIRED